MAVKYIFAAIALIFFLAVVRRLARDGGRLRGESRTWLLIGVIFAAVSAWLFSRR